MSLKTYKIKLTALGPIHIGSGTTIRKQEYIYDKYKSRVHIVNGMKMTKYFNERKILKRFVKYIDENPKHADLMSFLKQNNVKQEDWKKFIKYSLPVYQAENKEVKKYIRSFEGNSKKLNDIQTMNRDGNNDVYFPGSSLKGALRTIIQGYNEEVEDYDNENRYRDMKVSLSGFNKVTRDEVNALFTKLKISDSAIISSDNIAIYQKLDINKKARAMPLYRECIDVGTVIEFDMTIEDDVISAEMLEKMIEKYYQNYWEKYVSGFKKTIAGREVLEYGLYPNRSGVDKHEQILFVGGGSGFVSKTLYYQTQPQSLAKKNTFRVLQSKFKWIYGKMRSEPNNVPIILKGTLNTAKKELYQMGACKVEIIPNN